MYATQNGGCTCELASLSSTARLRYFFVLVHRHTRLVCALAQPDGLARGEREGYGGPRDVISLGA